MYKRQELENKAIIDIGNGWLTFYLKDKKPVWQIFCNEFEVLDAPASIPEGFSRLTEDETDHIPF